MNFLNSFRDIQKNETMFVCGCGESLSDLSQPEGLITIGVNDVRHCFHPYYIIAVNPWSQFSGDHCRYLEMDRITAGIPAVECCHGYMREADLGKLG